MNGGLNKILKIFIKIILLLKITKFNLGQKDPRIFIILLGWGNIFKKIFLKKSIYELLLEINRKILKG